MLRGILLGILMLLCLSACVVEANPVPSTPSPTAINATATLDYAQLTAYATYRPTLPASFTPTFTPTTTSTRTATFTPTLTLTPTETLTPSMTPIPSPIPLPPFTVNLASLVVLTPSNFYPNQHLASFPATGDNDQIFMSPNMAYFFVVSVPANGNYLANVYRFPEMELVTEGLPLASLPDNAFTSTIRFSQDSRFMTSFRLNGDEAVFYRVGEASYLVDNSAEGRIIHSGDMNASGILALSFSALDANGQALGEELCFIDKFGSSYAPNDRLCVSQDSQVYGLSFLPDGRRVLAAAFEQLRLYDVLTGELLETFDYRTAEGGTMALVPATGENGTLPTVMLSQKGSLLSVNLETGEERSYENLSEGIVYAITFTPDASAMLMLEWDGSLSYIVVLDIGARGHLYIDNYQLSDRREHIGFNPDGSFALIHNDLHETGTWEAMSSYGSPPPRICPCPQEANPWVAPQILGFSPDGKLLFFYNTNTGNFELWGHP